MLSWLVVAYFHQLGAVFSLPLLSQIDQLSPRVHPQNQWRWKGRTSCAWILQSCCRSLTACCTQPIHGGSFLVWPWESPVPGPLEWTCRQYWHQLESKMIATHWSVLSTSDLHSSSPQCYYPWSTQLVTTVGGSKLSKRVAEFSAVVAPLSLASPTKTNDGINCS